MALVETLSDRELQVFQALGAGETTQAIAKRLGLSVKTIETFRARICQKLGLKGGLELMRCACEWSLLVAE